MKRWLLSLSVKKRELQEPRVYQTEPKVRLILGNVILERIMIKKQDTKIIVNALTISISL